MGLSFLVPLFAAGLAALAIPIAVHLVHRERKEAVAFPSLMFLRRSPYQYSRRSRIRDWLLFAARCLLVALVAAAFARPVIARTDRGATALTGGREIVLLLDRSFSMRYGDRWPSARRQAQQVVQGVTARDRLTIIPFDTRAVAVNEATGDVAVLRTALDSISTVDLGTHLSPALSLARRVIGASHQPRKELIVISDYQRSAWDVSDDAHMPPGTKVVPIDVGGGGGDVRDHAVRTIETRRATDAGASERVIVSARVVNVGPAAKGVAASLEVSGRMVERRTVDLPADGGATVTFGGVPVPDAPVQARVVLEPDLLPGDDTYNFLLARAATVPVLLVEHSDAPPERGLFLSRALAIGDQPAFDVRSQRSGQATAADLGGRRLVILADAGVPPGIGPARLVEFVRQGGGLLLTLGEHTSASSWPSAALPLLPSPIGAPVDRLGQRGGVLGYLDRSHPALSLFGATRSGDLSSARFFRYRPIGATTGVMARFDDGSAALVEHRVGRGRVLIWASTFDGFWNDLPRQAVFLPFVQQLARYTAAFRVPRFAYPVGDAVDVSDALGLLSAIDTASAARPRFSVVAPHDGRLAVGGPNAPAALELRESGFYTVRRSGAPNERPRWIAANVAPQELEFASFDPARLTNAVAPQASDDGVAADADPVATLAQREHEQSLWWYLLLVAAAVLLVESFLAARVTQRRLQPR